MASARASSNAMPHIVSPEFVKVDTALTVLKQVNLLAESNALALDIGGSLAKLIYLQPHNPAKPSPPPLKIHQVDGSVATALSVHAPVLKGTLHFFAFETLNIHPLLRFIRDNWAQSNLANRQIRATGGGSFKYADTFRDVIDVSLSRLDELSCTVAGLNFLLTSVQNEVYTYIPLSPSDIRRSIAPATPDLTNTRNFIQTNNHPFPYLLVNIGSGVSIVKVTGHDNFERVSGSSLGGGTFWGLASLLLNCKTFDEIIDLAHDGDNANVDMLVGDIYGGSYASMGLDANVIAASFGKATSPPAQNTSSRFSFSNISQRFRHAVHGSFSLWLDFFASLPIAGSLLRATGLTSLLNKPSQPSTVTGRTFRPEDVALSLLRMVSYNIGQIAYLNARVHGLERIYFGGNFIRNHPYTISDISFAVDFWSSGAMKALFLRHDGYLGAIGAFIGASSATPTKFMQPTSKKSDVSMTKPQPATDAADAAVEGDSRDDANEIAESISTKKLSKRAAPGPKLQSEPLANSLTNGTTNDSVPLAGGHATEKWEHTNGHSSSPQDADDSPNGNGSHALEATNNKEIADGHSSVPQATADPKSSTPNGTKKSRRRKSKSKTSNAVSESPDRRPAKTPNGSQASPSSPREWFTHDDGNWTTVTRIRRRSTQKEKSVS